MTTYTGPERREPQGWHLKREIQLGHLITTITVVITTVIYIGRLEQRIALTEQLVQSQRERDTQQDARASETLTLLRSQLDRTEAKIDRLVERGGH